MKVQWTRGSQALLMAAALLPLGSQTTVRAQTEVAFSVVVHRDNPVSGLTAEQVSRLFLKRDRKWPDGTRAAPVDLEASSPVRESFSRAVHRRPVEAIKAYWQRLIFDGRETPPPEMSPSEVLEYVSANRGAIGYVGGDEPVTDGVKVLAIQG